MNRIIWETFIIIFIMIIIISCLLHIGSLIKDKSNNDTSVLLCLDETHNKIGEYTYEKDVIIYSNPQMLTYNLYCDTSLPNITFSNGILTYTTTDETYIIDPFLVKYQDNGIAIPNPKYYTKK